jgi:hypothetical protein
VDSYIVPNNRAPFAKYGVFAGLAIIIDDKNTEVIYNGETYTKGETLSICKGGKWYCASHSTHRRLSDDNPHQYIEKINSDIVLADIMGIQTGIIVFPYGAINPAYAQTMLNNGYQCGVNVYTRNFYNCKGCNPMYLTRVAIQNTYSDDIVKKAIV